MQNISVIGVGKLGLCFSLSLEHAGYNVLGVDVNQNYIDLLNNKTFISDEPLVTERLKKSKNFFVTSEIKTAVEHSDILFIVVATPSLENGKYDHTQVKNVFEKIKQFGFQEKKKHFVINCTTMPGFCSELQEEAQLYNWSISYNPEFIAQGTIIQNQENPDMVLIGSSDNDAKYKLEKIYKTFTKNNPKIFKMSTTEAEICKLSLNCFFTTKIAYTNMIGDIVLSCGGDPQTVLDAVSSDTRVGNKLTRYGYGFGGPCFPRDNRALGILAKEKQINAWISESTDKCNKEHLTFQVKQFLKTGITEVVLDTVTYKPESILLEESQQLLYAIELAKNNIKVIIKERKIVIKELKEKYGDLFLYIEKN